MKQNIYVDPPPHYDPETPLELAPFEQVLTPEELAPPSSMSITDVEQAVSKGLGILDAIIDPGTAARDALIKGAFFLLRWCRRNRKG